MFGRIVTTLKRLVGFQSSPALEQQELTRSASAKPLRAKSGRPSKAAQAQHQSNNQPAQSKPKRKVSPARKTTAAVSRKPEQKPAQTTSGRRGRPRKTPA